MSSVTYVAAYDPYHAMFRILTLLSNSSKKSIQVDVARILDFYICYPWLAEEFRASRDIAGQVKASNAVKRANPPSSYQVAPDSSGIYRRMRPAQLAAMSSLASKGIINQDDLANGVLSRTANLIPEKIIKAISVEREANPELYTFLNSIMKLPANGANGLKSRSGLEEFRYDNV